jgi:hypothetical protein
MTFIEPITLTEQMIESNSTSDKYKGLLNANFQDYMDAVKQASQLQIQSGGLKHRVTAIFSGLGLAAGSLGGPAGMASGFAVGNTIGKYTANVISNRVYGQAIADMSEIYHQSKLRHSQIATSLAFNDKMGEGIDSLRANENKRLKDALQAMAV